MRLVNADEVKRALMGWETDPTDEEIEITINRLSTVEAIPIYWIEEWCLSQDLEYVRIAIKKMMDNWKVEREEE